MNNEKRNNIVKKLRQLVALISFIKLEILIVVLQYRHKNKGGHHIAYGVLLKNLRKEYDNAEQNQHL